MNRNPYLEDRDKNDARANLPTRLKLLLGVVIALILALILQLAFLTIKQGASFEAEVNKSDETVEQGNAQRGLIYDSTGKVITGNKPQTAITYTRGKSTTALEIAKTAKTLSKYISIDTSRLSDRSKADYYLISNSKQATKIQAILEKQYGAKTAEAWSTTQLSTLEARYVMNHNLDKDIDENQAMIFQKMSGAYALSTTYIQESGVSDQAQAEIGERLSDMPGVKIGESFSRDYPEGDDFEPLVGKVSDTSTGLPADRLHTLLAQGYSQNEPVGGFALEKQYESLLKGSPSQTLISSLNGVKTSNLKYAGQAGDSLKLTINAAFQKKVQQILQDNLPGGDAQGAYATVINPYTGGIYAMGGISRNSSTGQKTANPLGNINAAIVMGSVVKPAILATGFQRGVVTPTSNTMYDQAIKIQGTPTITSYWNQGGSPVAVDADTALERSSNTYFVQLGMKIGGQTYSPGEQLRLRSDAFQTLRNGLAQFGLGTKTGIDIEGETAGYRGPTTGANLGKYLYESFGQYDSYTTLQLARYVSVIANGGYLVQPHLVGSILQNDVSGKYQKTVWSAQPQLQGQVSLTTDEWNIIKNGMYRVANGTDSHNTGSGLHNLNPKVYAKTGTAETITNGHTTYTDSVVAYVPGQPFAMSLAVPGLNSYLDGTTGKISSQIINAFWDIVLNKPS
ncbi:penicillin-binding protein 2B [Fructobacillus pseudoficulneus]|uniref:Penicillin-binding protein 2B n=1 Tax=Fructobacillus pseudoficulneus TaxID=220714 RepID=A0A3F3GS66_9LACO|nr:penicillin-binding protein 2 [Fructobacillus pseudoficulneus]GAP02464.1 penicillin-binding protein 2B [Fructobacillus pseudoficulneus]SEH37067.1 Cell division protein FtsI/penicillin-binding protein 2 [Fructobacillus pseudoficulneus]